MAYDSILYHLLPNWNIWAPDFFHVTLKVIPRLQDLADSAMENLRHSLGQKVLMLNPEEGAAAGTTRHCISCFKDRSQSPVRGSIGNLPMSWSGTSPDLTAECHLDRFLGLQPWYESKPRCKFTAA